MADDLISRLERERADADRAYNAALTALDRALLRIEPPTPAPIETPTTAAVCTSSPTDTVTTVSLGSRRTASGSPFPRTAPSPLVIRGPAPVLVNTSFNLFGEPLVCDPREAIRSFYCSGIDALVMGNFLVVKP